jgi:release factor glutamine methyltransferase
LGLVYRPAEDSWLLLKHVEARVSGLVLDMGTGGGIQAITAASKPEVCRVVAVDINPRSVEEAKKRATETGNTSNIEFYIGDLFRGLRGKFHWILFNPPYLPSEGEADEVSWSSGKRGCEVIEKFLSEAKTHLNVEGAILLVYSTLTGLDLDQVMESYLFEVLEELPLFFEKLFCLLLRPLTPF